MLPRYGSSRQRSRWFYLIVTVALMAAGFVFLKASWFRSASLLDPRATPRAVSPRGELLGDEKSTTTLFRQGSPSVVNITAIGVERDLFTLNLYQIPQGTG